MNIKKLFRLVKRKLTKLFWRMPPREFSKAEQEAFREIVEGFYDAFDAVWRPGPYIMPPHIKDEIEK